MQMRTRDSSGRANQTNLLTGRNRIPYGDGRLGQLEVGADQPFTLTDVDDAARKIERIDQRDDAACSRAYRRADRPSKVGPGMPALYLAIEFATRAECARDARGSRLDD